MINAQLRRESPALLSDADLHVGLILRVTSVGTATVVAVDATEEWRRLRLENEALRKQRDDLRRILEEAQLVLKEAS